MLDSFTTLNCVFFLLLLFVAAFLYSSVGHGGASGYLAVLALFGVDPAYMKSSSLILNIFVSIISFSLYYKNGNFKSRLFWSFAMGSIPASFIGALVILHADIYKKILGIALLLPIAKLIGVFGKFNEDTKEHSPVIAIILGVAIGLLSGMIGIGGGIILSPILLMLHWANMKQTSAISALFIFVNSIAGLMGMLTTNYKIDYSLLALLVVAIVGGFLGAYIGSTRINNHVLRSLLALVLLIAAFKLLLV